MYCSCRSCFWIREELDWYSFLKWNGVVCVECYWTRGNSQLHQFSFHYLLGRHWDLPYGIPTACRWHRWASQTSSLTALQPLAPYNSALLHFLFEKRCDGSLRAGGLSEEEMTNTFRESVVPQILLVLFCLYVCCLIILQHYTWLLLFCLYRGQSVCACTRLPSSWLQWRTSRRSWGRHSGRRRKNTMCCLWDTACHMTRDGYWPPVQTWTESSWRPASSA